MKLFINKQKGIPMKTLRLSVLWALSLLILIGCSDSPTNPSKVTGEQGDVKSVEYLNEYSRSIINQLLNQNGFTPPLTLTYNVEVYSVTYNTIDVDGNITEASGAIMVPIDASPAPLLSIQHGTVFYRNKVASSGALVPSEGPVGLAFSSAGYVTIIPDYLGYGVSTERHPYVHKDGTAHPVVDMIFAAREWSAEQDVSLDGDLFLGGYSEGGYVTMAAQMLIESEYATDLTVTASAPAAGPFDLSGFVDIVLEEMKYPNLPNVSFILTAYNDIYDWNMMSEMFQAPYDEDLPTLLDGSARGDDIAEALPDSLSDLLEPGFVQDVRDDNLPDLQQAFEENSLLDWSPQAPIHLYHGTADQLVDYQNSVTAKEVLGTRSASTVEFTTYDSLNHYESAPRAYYDMALWFDSLR